MFPKLSLAVTAVLATFAVASPTNSPPPPGTVNQCCNSVQASNSAAVAPVLSLLGIVLNAVVPVGLGCSPITIFGNNCPSTQVTCNSPTSQMGLIVIPCVPVTV